MGAEPATPQPIRAAARPGGRGSPGAQGAGLRLTVAVAGLLSRGAASTARRRELERRRRRRRRRVPARSGSWRSGVASRGGGGGGGGGGSGGVRAMLRVSLGVGVLTSS
ncbi:C-type natriuretic peptide-like [Globicephala melas]|uniref:C-type natriuretic peptide-like n=1 Tax=Globicephala melas TaxID=9731 RepID=UPI00122EF8B5|nr:methyl-CpG-binding domain protein 2-like [Globicephala melas]